MEENLTYQQLTRAARYIREVPECLFIVTDPDAANPLYRGGPMLPGDQTFSNFGGVLWFRKIVIYKQKKKRVLFIK